MSSHLLFCHILLMILSHSVHVYKMFFWGGQKSNAGAFRTAEMKCLCSDMSCLWQQYLGRLLYNRAAPLRFPICVLSDMRTSEWGEYGFMTWSVGGKNTINIIPKDRKIKKSNGDVTGAFLKSWESFNSKRLERPHKSRRLVLCLLYGQTLTPH